MICGDGRIFVVMTDLLLVTPGFPRDASDDGCIPPLQGYVRRLAAQGSTVRPYVLATQYPFVRGAYTWNEVSVFSCGGANKRWAKPFTWMDALRIGKGMYALQQVGAVHSFWLGECAWIGAQLARKFGVPHVLTLMGQDARDERNWWRMIRNGSTQVVALSQRQADEFKRMSGRVPDAIIPWGIEELSPVPMKDRDIDLLFVGSLIPVKRPERFIGIVRRISAERPLRAVMCGARIPAANRSVDSMVQAAGLSHVIEVTGELPRHEVLAIMARSRVLVHPSRYESQGFVFNEALMQGMSIVSHAVGVATASDRWCVIDDQDDLEGMVRQVRNMLQGFSAGPMLVPHRMDTTVAGYRELYNTV